MSPEIGGDAILENGLARSDSFIGGRLAGYDPKNR